MSIVCKFKDHKFGLKTTPNTWFYRFFDKVMNDYVSTRLEKKTLKDSPEWYEMQLS